jgi:aminopeptidase N
MFDFLERNRGEVPLKVYKQIPVRDFLYAGMENTSATVFSSRYVGTGFEDRNYTNVNAHELAHQWFGI